MGTSSASNAPGDIAPQTITVLSSSGTPNLIVRFNPVARGALLEVLEIR